MSGHVRGRRPGSLDTVRRYKARLCRDSRCYAAKHCKHGKRLPTIIDLQRMAKKKPTD